MSEINEQSTVAAWVRAMPIRAGIFENLGIDYCCGGKKPLAEICARKGLDVTTVVAMLKALDAVSDSEGIDVEQLSLRELCDHIERQHHDWLRQELPRLDFMTEKVARVHGDSEPRLVEIRKVFESFGPDLVEHTVEEESSVFPLIRKLESNPGEAKIIAENLRSAIQKLEAEHDQAGSALERFSELTDRYQPPEWACNTFRALYDTLERLERNMHQHVHKENNILFPAALAMAANR